MAKLSGSRRRSTISSRFQPTEREPAGECVPERVEGHLPWQLCIGHPLWETDVRPCGNREDLRTLAETGTLGRG
jgi:hypothetical protein